MTDGTSQGLFVVVAIVIFGIFVALSQTVFGDYLSNSLGELTHTAVATSSYQAKGFEVLDTIKELRLVENLPGAENNQRWLSYSSDLFEQDGEYTLEFDITNNNGNLTYLGGHYHIGDFSEVFVDDEHYTVGYMYRSNPWRQGFELTEPIAVGETRRVVANFKMDRYDNPTHSYTQFRFEPNRLRGESTFDVTISNLIFYKTN